MSDLYYFWGQISQNLPPKKSLILLSDLIKNSIYLNLWTGFLLYTAKRFIEGSYPAWNPNLNI